MVHSPVLLSEVIDFLVSAPGKHYIDATVGEGGHAKAILEKTAPSGILLGIDRDGDQIQRAKENLLAFGKRVVLRKGSFGGLKMIAYGITKNNVWNGILFDLGWSLMQKERSGRGFTFQSDEPLDMRYEAMSKEENALTATKILNEWKENDIETMLMQYSKEHFAKAIARAIITTRRKVPIRTTLELVSIIKGATPVWYHHRRIHLAAKTFQALRIAVNREFEEIQKGLEDSIDLLSEKGRLVVISFHSGEDRMVKNMFKKFAHEGHGIIVTKKPVTPSFEERQGNPHCRSAKLRVFEFFSSSA